MYYMKYYFSNVALANLTRIVLCSYAWCNSIINSEKIVMIVIITNDSFILKITRVIFITFIIFHYIWYCNTSWNQAQRVQHLEANLKLATAEERGHNLTLCISFCLCSYSRLVASGDRPEPHFWKYTFFISNWEA